jgi:DNA-binding LacI/PurR family transcriptional regulator
MFPACYSLVMPHHKVKKQPRFRRVADLIKERILLGTYAFKPLPSDRQLATECGVNYMTVRRGLQLLIDEGLLLRQTNGRIQVTRATQGHKPCLNIAFLVPTIASPHAELWRMALETEIAKLNGTLRTILYVHWHDPMLMDCISGFDGVFLAPENEPIPSEIAERLRKPEHPVVIVDQDYSHLGLPTIKFFPPSSAQRLLNHLVATGRKRIACLNVQPIIPEVQERMDQWKIWTAVHHHQGPLINEPVTTHHPALPHAYKVMKKLLKSKNFDADAIYCVTLQAAIGAMRALWDHGLEPGKEIAVCAINGEGMAPMLKPTLTALEFSDPTPFVTFCLKWMADGGKTWTWPLLMQPAEVPLYIGESTRPTHST